LCDVVFHLFFVEVVFHDPTIEIVFHNPTIEVVFQYFNYLSCICYRACQADFKLFHYYSGRAGGRVAGLNENKANSAHQLKLELGLG
jgi:hypothetical protein